MTDRLLDVFLGFIAGINVGMGIATWIFYVKFKDAMLNFYSREKAVIEKLAAQNTKSTTAVTPVPQGQDDSVTMRLNKASELTRIQNEIIVQAQQPSQNALHSRHKNGLIQQYKALEVEKMGILHSIIKEGHDPVVTVYNAAAKQNEEVKLSFFLNQLGTPVQPETSTDPNLITEGEGIRKVEKKGKTFYVIDGGKKTTQ